MKESEQDPARRYYSAPRIRARQLRQIFYPRRCPYCRRVLGYRADCLDCREELKKQERAPSRRLDPAVHYFGMLDGAAAPFCYEGMPREAVLRAKYSGERVTAVQLGCRMVEMLFGVPIQLTGAEELPVPVPEMGLGYDLVVPVPDSGRGRGYNVPQLMALPIAYGLHLPLADGLLHKVRRGKPQAGLPRYERLVNAAGAYAAEHSDRLEGKRVLLVDDVITTGATAAACAQALLDAGAESVFAVALAAAQPLHPAPAAQAGLAASVS